MKNTKIKQQFSENFKNIPKSFIREILNVAGSGQMISFAGGLPNPSFFPAEVRFTKPGGGMFLWLNLPGGVDAAELVNRTMKRNVVFVPGSSFFVSSNGQANVRMNFSNASSAKMEEGIRVIAAELKEMIQRVKV